MKEPRCTICFTRVKEEDKFSIIFETFYFFDEERHRITQNHTFCCHECVDVWHRISLANFEPEKITLEEIAARSRET